MQGGNGGKMTFFICFKFPALNALLSVREHLFLLLTSLIAADGALRDSSSISQQSNVP